MSDRVTAGGLAAKDAALLAVAILAGLAIAWVDTRPGWDDAGVTATALLVTSGLCALVAGRRPWLWALAVGVWTPILTLAAGGTPGSLVALIPAFVGAYSAWLMRRGRA